MKKITISLNLIILFNLFAISNLFGSDKIKWQRDIGSTISTFLSEDSFGNIYLGTDTGILYKLDSLGNILFEYKTQSGELNTPVIDVDGTIYFGSDNSKLYALTTTGQLKWIFDINENEGVRIMGDQWVSNIAVNDDGTIYFNTGNSSLYSVGVDGTLNWKKVNHYYWNPIVGYDNMLITACDYKNIHAFNKDGSLKWKYPINDSYPHEIIALSTNRSIIVVDSKTVLSLNYSGELNWSYEHENYIDSSPVIDSNNDIYLTDKKSNILSLSSDGSLKWTLESSNLVGNLSIANNGVVYYGKRNLLYSFNTSGSHNSGWSFYKKDKIKPFILGNNGNIYMAVDKVLYCISTISNGRELSSWSCVRGSSNRCANINIVHTKKTCRFSHLNSYNSSTKIDFTDNSAGEPLEWFWDFGDGQSSSEQNPTHQYSSHGIYKVQLSVKFDTITLSHFKIINTRLFWKYNIANNFQETPALDSYNNVISGGGNNHLYLYSINQKGQLNWRIRTKGKTEMSPVISNNGSIYIGGYFTKYFSSISTNGEINWDIDNVWIRSSPAVDPEGNIYMGINDRYLTSISNEGEVNWQISNGSRSSPSVLSTNKVYFGGRIYSYSGEEVKTNSQISIGALHCIDNNGDAYYASGNDIIAIDKDWNIKWSYSTSGEIWSSPVISDNAVYVGNIDGKLYSINKFDGTSNWSYLTEGYINKSPAIAQNNSIVFSNSDSCIFSLNTNGVLQWKEKTRGDILSSIIIDTNGTVVVCCGDANIYAFATDNGGLKKNNWSCIGANARHTGYIEIESSTKANLQSDIVINTFPNPTTGIIQIDGLPQDETTVISIFNVMGQKLDQKEINTENSTIDLSIYKKGAYYLSFNNNFMSAVKIIKE